MKNWLLHKRCLYALIIVTFFATSADKCLADKVSLDKPVKTVKPALIEKHRINGYDLKLYIISTLPNQEMKLTVTRKGHTVFTFSDYHLEIGVIDDVFSDEDSGSVRKKRPPFLGKDITGNKIPDVVIGVYTGGAHCCFEALILELGTTFRNVGKISSEHSSVTIKDLNKDGKHEVIVDDWVFAYTAPSFGDTPTAKVVLEFDGKKYRVSPRLLKRYYTPRALTSTEINTIRSKWSRHPDEAASLLTGELMSLLYSGNTTGAAALLKKVVPENRPQALAFIDEFINQLYNSIYWQQMGIPKNKLRDTFQKAL